MAYIIGYDANDQPIYGGPDPAPVMAAPAPIAPVFSEDYNPAPLPAQGTLLAQSIAATGVDPFSATPTSPSPGPGYVWSQGSPVTNTSGGSQEETQNQTGTVAVPSAWNLPPPDEGLISGFISSAIKNTVTAVTNPGFLLAVAPPIIGSMIAAAPVVSAAAPAGDLASLSAFEAASASVPNLWAPAAADLVAASVPAVAAPAAADFAGGGELATASFAGGGELSGAASSGFSIGGASIAAGAAGAGLTLGEVASGASAAAKLAGSAATIAGAAAAVAGANDKAKNAADLASLQAYEDAAATVPANSSAAAGFWTMQNIVLASAAALGLAYFLAKGGL